MMVCTKSQEHRRWRHKVLHPRYQEPLCRRSDVPAHRSSRTSFEEGHEPAEAQVTEYSLQAVEEESRGEDQDRAADQILSGSERVADETAIEGTG